MTQTTDETRTVPFRGRDITLQNLLPAQTLLIIKMIRDLRRAGTELQGSILDVAKILDILESALPNPEDVEFIEDLIIKRQLDLKEIVYLLAGKNEEPVEKPRVRRGRPRKATSAAK